MNTQKRLLISLAILLVIIIVGIAGYYSFDRRYSFIDSLYMTIITIFSVGYREVQENPNLPTKIFTVVIIIFGCGTIALVTAALTAFIIEGQIAQYFRRQKMQKEIDKLKKHYIICGAGSTGSYVVDEFIKTKTDFVLIDVSEKSIAGIKEEKGDFPSIVGDATQDFVLIKAGVERATGIVTVLPQDKDNLFVVITARGLNKNIRIVSKAIEEETTKKLVKVGADSVVSPTAIGGLRMASVMLRPTVVSFLDTMMRGSEMVLRVDEVTIEEGSSFIGRTVAEVDIGKKTGTIVVAIKESETGRQKFNPPSNTVLKAGDVLILIGSVEQVQLLRQLASKEGLSITSEENVSKG